MPTIKDLTIETGFSRSTISRVINGGENVNPETKKLVLEAIEKIGYKPDIIARSMVTGSIPMIQVIVGDIQNHWFTEPLSGIEEVLEKSGRMVVVYDCSYNPSKEIEAIRMAKVCHFEGIIPMTGFGSEAVISELQKSGIPTVLLNAQRDIAQFDKVYGDDYTSGYNATQLLINSGFKRIFHLSGDSVNSHISQARENGYKDAMKNNGLNVDNNMIVKGNLRLDGGRSFAEKYLNSKNIGICCNNFLMALGIINYAHEKQYQPLRDYGLAICEQPPGFYEDSHLLSSGPSLKDIGENAAKMLLYRIANPEEKIESKMISVKNML